MRWLIDHIGKTPVPAPARDVRDHAIRLADPHDRWAALRAIPGGEDIATAWSRRRAALGAYRDTLVASGQTAPEVVLPDLAHMHHVRMIGICPDTERACARLARAAALSWTARTQGAWIWMHGSPRDVSARSPTDVSSTPHRSRPKK